MEQPSANPQTDASPAEITLTADIQPPRQMASIRQSPWVEQAIVAQLIRDELESDSSTSLLTAKLKRLIHAEIADPLNPVQREGRNRSDMDYYQTLWIMIQIPVLGATFGMSVYSTVYAKKNNAAAVEAANAAQNATQIATDANRIAAQNANAAEVQTNNGASLNFLGVYQFCESHSNFTFANGTSCSYILQQPVPYPTINTVPTSSVSGAHSLQLRGFVDRSNWIIIWAVLWLVHLSR